MRERVKRKNGNSFKKQVKSLKRQNNRKKNSPEIQRRDDLQILEQKALSAWRKLQSLASQERLLNLKEKEQEAKNAVYTAQINAQQANSRVKAGLFFRWNSPKTEAAKEANGRLTEAKEKHDKLSRDLKTAISDWNAVDSSRDRQEWTQLKKGPEFSARLQEAKQGWERIQQEVQQQGL